MKEYNGQKYSIEDSEAKLKIKGYKRDITSFIILQFRAYNVEKNIIEILAGYCILCRY